MGVVVLPGNKDIYEIDGVSVMNFNGIPVLISLGRNCKKIHWGDGQFLMNNRKENKSKYNKGKGKINTVLLIQCHYYL